MPKITQLLSVPNDGDDNDVNTMVPEHHLGLCETKGWRRTQEDAAYGCWYTQDTFQSLTPQQIGQRLWTSYHLLHQQVRDKQGDPGTTASTTVYDGKGNLITATLADSVAFAVVYDNQGALLDVVRLNKIIHHPNDEAARITRAGGSIVFNRVNGGLAVSRAIGDFSYASLGVIADASIDINNLDELYKSLGKTSADVGKVQIITTCDGFTEPLGLVQTKEMQEAWMRDCLNEMTALDHLSELDLAKELVSKALEGKPTEGKKNSTDNISVAVQTVLAYNPFLIGIYDGHGGSSASILVAQNIGDVFDQQCSLTQEAYACQPLSAEKNFITYYRDNADTEWYEPLAEAEKKLRTAEISSINGINSRITELKKRTQEARELLGDKNHEFHLFLDVAEEAIYFMETLSARYIDLTISAAEFIECADFIFQYESEIDIFKYQFLSLDFVQQKLNVAILCQHDGYVPLLWYLAGAIASLGNRSSVMANAVAAGLSIFSAAKDYDAMNELDESPEYSA